MSGKKTLVAYFSASGVTKKAAELLTEVADADIYEIRPETPYTMADLDWTNKKSRSTIEMSTPAFRPAILGECANMAQYDTIFIGFPIWWYVAPTIINTFLESYDFAGKTLIPFATSGSSGLGKTEQVLKSVCGGNAKWLPGKMVNRATKESLTAWVQSLGL